VPADFHVAVAHSGGGKRAFFNSLGDEPWTDGLMMTMSALLSLQQTGRSRRALHQAWYHSRSTAYQCVVPCQCQCEPRLMMVVVMMIVTG
jgi:hypothetical protein